MARERKTNRVIPEELRRKMAEAGRKGGLTNSRDHFVRMGRLSWQAKVEKYRKLAEQAEQQVQVYPPR